MKTEGVYDLSRDVLLTLPTPYKPDIIEDVFVAIEDPVHWQREIRQDRDLSGREH